MRPSYTVWILDHNMNLFEETVSGTDDLRRIIKSPAYEPHDCDLRCLRCPYSGLSIYMLYTSCSALSQDSALSQERCQPNFIAARILLDKWLLEPPVFTASTCCIRGVAVLHAAKVHSETCVEMRDYPITLLRRHWHLLFVLDAPYWRHYLDSTSHRSAAVPLSLSPEFAAFYLRERWSGKASQSLRMLQTEYGSHLVRMATRSGYDWTSFCNLHNIHCYYRKKVYSVK